MPTKKAVSNSLSEKLKEIRKKDATLRIGSLSDFDLNVIPLTTSNLSLDNAIGVGGFPRGRVIELFGPSQSGKTTSALQAAAAHQKRVKAGTDTGAIIYLDFERSLDEDYCVNLGIDPHDADTFIVAHPHNFEHGANLFRMLLEEGFLAMGIFDSVAAMVSEKEQQALTGAITVGDRAKALHQFMRQIKGPLHDYNVAAIFLNHVMQTIETSPMGRKMAGQGIIRKTTPGGTALVFYSDVRVEFTQIGTQKTNIVNPVTQEVEKVQTSTDVQAKVVKNKVSKPQRVAKMRVRYGKGFSQPYSVFQVLVAYKIIKVSSNGWITVPAEFSPEDGDWKVQGEETVIRRLETDENWMTKMETKAKELVEGYTPDQDTDDVDYDPNIDPETGEVRE